MRSKEARSQWQALCQVDPIRVTDVRKAIEAARLAQQLGDMRLSSRWAARAEQLAARLGGVAIADVESKRAKIARIAGRMAACRQYLERALRANPTSTLLREHAADLLQSFGDLEGAAAYLFDASDTSKNAAINPNLLLRHASIAAARAKPAEARAGAERIAANDTSSAAQCVSAGHIFLSISDFDDASRCFDRAIKMDGQCLDAHVAMAFLNLHRGQTHHSIPYATRALELAPNHPHGRLVQAMARLFRGEKPQNLLKDFDSLVHEMPSNAEALALRAQARRMAGDVRGALEDLLLAKHSGNEAQNFLFDLELVALGRQIGGFLSIEEMTAIAKTPEARSIRAPVYWPAVRKTLRHAEPLLAKTIWSLPQPALRLLAERIRDRSREDEGELAAPRSLRLRLLAMLCPDEFLRSTHGNRSLHPTYLHPLTGRLTPLDLRRSARHRSKAAQWTILYSAPDEVLRSFEAITHDHPRSHHPNAYRGEVLLWLGRYEEAAADFQNGLKKNPRARWLYIGMGAVQFFQGNTAEAIASFQRSVDVAPLFVGPTLHAYRGEAFRLAGRTGEAVDDLQIACRDNPSRISSWVNLWLAHDDLGHVTERDAVMDELWGRARYLLSDAADECFSCSFYQVESSAKQRQLLEHVLHMMRGNRSSSCVTYFTKTLELRTVIG